MTTYYSIIYASIRPEVSEKLSLGLIFNSGNQLYYKVSSNKLDIVKGLLPSGPFKAIKDGLNNIQKKFNEYQKLSIENSKLGFNEMEIPSEFSVSYMEYLSNYNNNLLTFSIPTPIEVEMNQEIFMVYFKKFVDDRVRDPKPTISIKRPFLDFRKIYLKTHKEHFNTEKELTSKEIPNLVFPLKFDLVGKNEKPVVAEFIDFQATSSTIKNQLNLFFAFKEAEPKSQRFLVSSEPNIKNYPEQHSIWNGLLKTKNLVEYIDIKEVGRIDEYAKEHSVTPF